jgi:predicted transcriptional regulator
MKTKQLLKNKVHHFIKDITRELLLNENSNLDDTILLIAQKFGIPKRQVKSFVDSLYRKGLLVKYNRGKNYSLTLAGLSFLLGLAEGLYIDSNLRGGDSGHRTS